MIALSIDPGSRTSAAVRARILGVREPPWGIRPYAMGDFDNEELRLLIWQDSLADVLIVEVMPSVFLGAAARDQLVAERWAGRFIEAHTAGCERADRPARVIEVARATAKAATIGRARGTDSELRRAIIDAYGGDDVAFGAKCKPCKGRGWRGVGRPVCTECGGSGWRVPPGPLKGFKGSHVFAALALQLAAFEPGGLYDKAEFVVRSSAR